jgi:hypothetical protein
MGLERNRHRLGPLLPRPTHYLTQNVAVSTMYPVEVPDAYQRRSEVRRNLLEFVKDFQFSSSQPKMMGKDRKAVLCVLCD